MIKRVASALIVALTLGAACELAAPPPPDPPPPPAPRGSIDLRVHVVGDFHGALEGAAEVGGAAYFAAHLEARRAGAEHTLFVAAGDLIGASPLPSALQHDEPTLQAMAAMGLAASALGNHELDDGIDELLRLQNGGCHPDDACDAAPWPGTGFPFLAANLTRDDGTRPLAASIVVDVAGARIGILGIALQNTPAVVVSSAVEGLVFLDELDAIRAEAAALRETGVDAVLALTHTAGGPGPAGACVVGPVADLAVELAGEVDLLVSGHSHASVTCVVDGLPVIATGARGELLGEIDFTLDLDEKTVTAAEPVLFDVDHSLPPDAAIEAMVNEAVETSAVLGGEVVGSITAGLSRLPSPVTGQGTLGSVITDAQRAATQEAGAQIAFQQNGGIRADLLMPPSGDEADGEVTFAELFAVHPFGNELVTVTLTGAEIAAILADQFQSAEGVLQVSGLSYTWRPVALGVDVDPATILVGGAPIDVSADYRVTVNSFLVGTEAWLIGRDPQFGPVDVDALTAWFRAQSPIAPPNDERITTAP